MKTVSKVFIVLAVMSFSFAAFAVEKTGQTDSKQTQCKARNETRLVKETPADEPEAAPTAAPKAKGSASKVK